MSVTSTHLYKAENLIGQALTIYDRHLRLSVSNARFQEMFGLPDHLVELGAPFSETIRYLAGNGEYGDVGDIDTFVQSRAEQALAFEPHYMERQRANGMWISVEGSPLGDNGWITVYTDISDIKAQDALLRSEGEKLSSQLLTRSEELAQTNRRLAATISALEETKRHLIDAEARSRMTAEMTPAHIAHINRAGVYTYSNRKLDHVVSGRSTDIVGLSCQDALGQDAYSKIKPFLDRAFAGEPTTSELDLEDATRRVRIALTPDIAADGTVQGAYVLSMDITSEAQARAAILQTRKRELAAQLTSGLAHDFANLLTVILGVQGQMERISNLPQSAKDAISTTKSAALRGGALLDRLSDVAGRRDLSITAVQIDDLFADLEPLANAALPQNITLSLENVDFATPLLLDRGFVQDSLLNLILNARDAIDGTGEIHVKAIMRGTTWVEFSVSDTGTGFSQTALEHALDPFFTTKSGDGSGLGLTMVYDHAQLTGGRVRIANSPQGAVVKIQLPLRPGAQTKGANMVLLVEDQDDLRTSIRAMLRDLGLTVLETNNANEAIALASVPGLHLILSDIMLDGDMTGFDMAQQLSQSGSKLPVIMMTGLPKTDPIREQATARFPLLSKPFSADQLRQKLQEVAA